MCLAPYELCASEGICDVSTAAGRAAEDVAAQFLAAKGCTVREQNWRTRWCEIDIIATRGNVVYMVEVKYRAKSIWGGGLDYITPKKLRQMRFAAEFWCAKHHWQGDYRLAAIEVTGNPPRITRAVNSIE